MAKGEAAGELRVVEERSFEGIDKGEGPDPVVSAVGLDEGGPGLELGFARCEDGLEGEEGREVVERRELEVRGCRRRVSCSGHNNC